MEEKFEDKYADNFWYNLGRNFWDNFGYNFWDNFRDYFRDKFEDIIRNNFLDNFLDSFLDNFWDISWTISYTSLLEQSCSNNSWLRINNQVLQLHNRKIVHKSWNSWIDDHLSRRGRKVNFVMKFYTLFPKPFCGKGDQMQYDIFFNIFSKI